jgi:hypothetical protein
MTHETIETLSGTQWTGTGELWLDPLGNEATTYDCTLQVDDGAVRYTWNHEGEQHRGTFELGADDDHWHDSWHASERIACERRPEAWGLVTLWCTYPAGEGPPWGWRTTLARRPGGELVLQMTNCTPWGEEGRAVRMVFTRLD